jgi:hypothetical protein
MTGGCATRLKRWPECRRCARRGLAPLELVLSLFFLLVMMALIINFGTTAPWHVRGQIAARHAVWRTLSGRTGQSGYPNPPNWWPPATMSAVQGIPLNANTVGQVWNGGDLMQPALRGPVITDPATGRQILMNNLQYLEMVNQAEVGTASLTKAMPLLPKLRKAAINPRQPVIDHLWRFSDMNPQSGGVAMRQNGDWRTYGWYRIRFEELGNGDLMKLFLQFQQTDQKIQQNPDIASLWPLDRDNEFPPWGLPSPDVYPILAGCDDSPRSLQRNAIMNPRGLIDRIRGNSTLNVPGVSKTLAQKFIELYKKQIQFYQSQQPPDQAEVQRLQNLIQQLQQVK